MDEYDRIVLSHLAWVRPRLEALRFVAENWVPREMPEDWDPYELPATLALPKVRR